MQRVIHGDCREVMRTFPDHHFHSVVEDPPGALSFMGHDWDTFGARPSQVKSPSMEAADSDYHRVRGIPISQRIKAKEPFMAFMREVFQEKLRIVRPGAYALVWTYPGTSHWTAMAMEDAGWEIRDLVAHLFGTGRPKGKSVLNPAHEPWVLARAPLSEANVEANIARWGTGRLAIDAARIGEDIVGWGGGAGFKKTHNASRYGGMKAGAPRPVKGRWPSNVVVSHECDMACVEGCAVRRVQEQGGQAGWWFVAKPSEDEKRAGVESSERHDTVKPIALMKHFVTLVNPPGGTVLDSFCGSGTTGVACVDLGVPFVGIERNAEYAQVAEERMRYRISEGLRESD